MRKLLLAAAAIVAGVSLSAGAAAAQTGGGTISGTGPDSSATIKTKVKSRTYLHNKNTFNVSNSSSQSAYSGDAKVRDNTTGGSATSGGASNANSLTLSAMVDNDTSGAVGAAQLSDFEGGGGSISNTGPDSYARVSTKVSSSTVVKNENTFNVSNNSSQMATSGDAKVSHNTTGGGATSGNASNTNSTSVTFNVSN